MTEVYSVEKQRVVANGDSYVKIGQCLYDVPNCLPLNGPEVGERYQLREALRPMLSVKCIAQGQPGIQTARFQEV